ncbi:MAG: hypothetical protein M1833_001812 [Piccolia ochrophora]|nr:MAG: hypothetical protein M1833_001812 [Piccolia ochrophora]
MKETPELSSLRFAVTHILPLLLFATVVVALTIFALFTLHLSKVPPPAFIAGPSVTFGVLAFFELIGYLGLRLRGERLILKWEAGGDVEARLTGGPRGAARIERENESSSPSASPRLARGGDCNRQARRKRLEKPMSRVGYRFDWSSIGSLSPRIFFRHSAQKSPPVSVPAPISALPLPPIRLVPPSTVAEMPTTSSPTHRRPPPQRAHTGKTDLPTKSSVSLRLREPSKYRDVASNTPIQPLPPNHKSRLEPLRSRTLPVIPEPTPHEQRPEALRTRTLPDQPQPQPARPDTPASCRTSLSDWNDQQEEQDDDARRVTLERYGLWAGGSYGDV